MAGDSLTGAAPIEAAERDSLLAMLGTSPVGLCVSGGADSMALMHLVAGWQAAGRPGVARAAAGAPQPVVVLTVDHGLRAEAAGEARFVAETATALGFEARILRASGPAPATGVQAWARDERRRLVLAALADAREAAGGVVREDGETGFVAVMAHHLGDQAETVLMRLARGSGIDGLSGMRAIDHLAAPATPERPFGVRALLMRPLLGVPRERLVATLSARGLMWIEDPSNTDRRFERVRVREALGALREAGVGVEAIGLSARRLGQARAALDSLLRRKLDELADWHGGMMGTLPLDVLADVAGAYGGVRVVAHLLAAFGGTARGPELAEIEALWSELMSGRRRAATLGGCHVEVVFDGEAAGDRERATTDGHGAVPAGAGRTLRVFREMRDGTLPSSVLAPGGMVAWDGGRFTLTADRGLAAAVDIAPLGAEGWRVLVREVPGLEFAGVPRAAPAGLPAALSGLPAAWRSGRLVAVPWLAARLADCEAEARAAYFGALGPEAGSVAATFTGLHKIPPLTGR
ncbi:MAG: tRNA lysidine(34) synthetase TilS [Hyphomicrobiaceae bacterium]|nr:tRNA lysidine(34) synthetase TilS [Hyphomicrobiaceae bacterium]